MNLTQQLDKKLSITLSRRIKNWSGEGGGVELFGSVPLLGKVFSSHKLTQLGLEKEKLISGENQIGCPMEANLI